MQREYTFDRALCAQRPLAVVFAPMRVHAHLKAVRSKVEGDVKVMYGSGDVDES